MTKTQVCNRALDMIRSSPMVDFEDTTTAEGRYLNRNYEATARLIMRSYPWNFAKDFREIPADADAPPFKWSYAYTLPTGWARVIPPTRYGNRYGETIPHEIVGNKVYTNEPAPLRVVLVMDKSANPGEWDDLMTQIVVCTLALGMANKFTGKSKFVELASQLLSQATEAAQQIDAYEGPPEPTDNFDIIRVRGGDEAALSRRW